MEVETIKYTKGDLVRDAERDFDVIAHGCNCYCVFGAGIALTVKRKYPQAYSADKASAFADKGKLGTYTQWSNDNITILNMYTQWDYKGRNINADYDAIRGCMKAMKSEFSGKKIGLPLIGSGLAGGDFYVIEKIISEELLNEDVTIVVWEKDYKNLEKYKSKFS
jgi:O-acetyl-ADP-ribose deacetylase (regulator of RNase III)